MLVVIVDPTHIFAARVVSSNRSAGVVTDPGVHHLEIMWPDSREVDVFQMIGKIPYGDFAPHADRDAIIIARTPVLLGAC